MESSDFGMSAAIVTFANLGKKQNLKTPDIVPVIDAFAAHGDLDQVICQINSRFHFSHTQEALPVHIRYPLKLYEKVARKSVSRDVMERFVDVGARRKLIGTDAVIFHGGYFLPQTNAKAARLGSLRIDIPVSAHIRTNAELEAAELNALGITDYEGWYMRLAQQDKHSDLFDYIIALSSFVKDTYISAGYPSDRIYLASPDIDTKRFTPLRKEDQKFRVVYAAYTAQLKGLHYLFDAWKQLKLPDAELVVVGGYGEMPRELEERYNRFIQEDSSVRFVGHTLTPEHEYQRANVLVFPSLTEGFGRVTLEAMACGIPVITTENARGIVEDGKTGFVVPIRDVGAMAQKLQYLYEHQDQAKAMGKAARAAVEAKPSFGEAVYAIYRDIMRREGKI